MARAALKQMAPIPAPDCDDTVILAREAARLASIAASFALFGLRLDDVPETAWNAPAGPYRIRSGPAETPANDATPAFPASIEARPLLAPSLPAKSMQTLDWLFVLLAAQTAALWATGSGLAMLPVGEVAAYFAAAAALKFGLWLTESYRFSLSQPRFDRTLGGLALGAIAGIVLANFAADARAAAALATVLPVTALLLAGVHVALLSWTAALHRRGAFSERVVVVGATEAAQRFTERAERSGDAHVLAIVDDRKGRAPAHVNGAPVAGDINDLMRWPGLAEVERIVVAVPLAAEARLKTVLRRLAALPQRVDVLIDIDTHSVRGRGLERLAGAAVACVSGRPHNHRRAALKRALDVSLAAAALLFLAPALATIAVLVKCGSRGPVLFHQRRKGFNNRPFTLFKFRTLELDGVTPTRFGAFLRRSGLDELPQLVNVLCGEMSLVGPRPHAVDAKAGARAPEAIVAEYAHRHRSKPGISGWAQINGLRGGPRTPAALRERMRFDLDYVQRSSLWLDLQIIARTPAIMLRDAFAQK